MRTSKYNLVTAPNAVPLGLLVPPSPVRVALMVSVMGTDPIFVTPDASAAVLSGFKVTPESGPLLLRREDLGDVITGAWYVSAMTSAQSVPVMDISDSAWRDR